MSTDLVRRVREEIEAQLASLGVEPRVEVTLEVPPRAEFGDLACPVAFELAKRLKRPPREIASDLKERLERVPGVERADVAGAGYLNIYFDRDLFLRTIAGDLGRARAPSGGDKRVVEHTNINPNKAAHIGHLRNAVLGDTLVRCLRFLGETVEVQNYIDDTGVQVADLAVGFVEIRRESLDGVREIAELCSREREWTRTTRVFVRAGRSEEAAAVQGGHFEVLENRVFPANHPFDHYCWDLYTEVAPFYAASEENAAKRIAALKQMEEQRGPYAEVAAFVSRQMVLHHLRTMRWIRVTYDLLPRESDILALGFWEHAFTLLKESGAIRLATEGKAKGCWVMDLPEAAETEDETAKIIVRSNGTVTYVGKDIAYQMWKFGLLGRDFSYRLLDTRELPPNRTDTLFSEIGGAARPVWTTCSADGEQVHPQFGDARRVYNVIDARQSYLQKVVAQGLDALGHRREARESIHFSYEMVALTPRSVELLRDLGSFSKASIAAHDVPAGDETSKASESVIVMSGRHGIGIKAEELLTGLANRADQEVGNRRPDASDDERSRIAVSIAVGALRYYMLRFTKNRVVAFDLEDALAFEGETGPYLQYAAVRSRNIFNKLSEREGFDRRRTDEVIDGARFAALDPSDVLEHWQIAREIARLPEIVEQAVGALEMSILARYVFSVAQRFSTFYHRYPILHEGDPARRDLRIALNEIYLRFMERSLDLMGVPLPERM